MAMTMLVATITYTCPPPANRLTNVMEIVAEVVAVGAIVALVVPD
jgi:hypothetical protein